MPREGKFVLNSSTFLSRGINFVYNIRIAVLKTMTVQQVTQVLNCLVVVFIYDRRASQRNNFLAVRIVPSAEYFSS